MSTPDKLTEKLTQITNQAIEGGASKVDLLEVLSGHFNDLKDTLTLAEHREYLFARVTSENKSNDSNTPT